VVVRGAAVVRVRLVRERERRVGMCIFGIGDDWVRGVVRGVCGDAGRDVEEGRTVRGVGTRDICRRLQSTSRPGGKYVPTC
jgi:hypothetical protein